MKNLEKEIQKQEAKVRSIAAKLGSGVYIVLDKDNVVPADSGIATKLEQDAIDFLKSKQDIIDAHNRINDINLPNLEREYQKLKRFRREYLDGLKNKMLKQA